MDLFLVPLRFYVKGDLDVKPCLDRPAVYFSHNAGPGRKKSSDLHGPKGGYSDGGVDLVSDVLPFGRLWYGEPNAINNAIGYAKFPSRSHDAVIRVYDDAGNLTQTHEHTDDFKEW
jgi:hypothetical protein